MSLSLNVLAQADLVSDQSLERYGIASVTLFFLVLSILGGIRLIQSIVTNIGKDKEADNKLLERLTLLLERTQVSQEKLVAFNEDAKTIFGMISRVLADNTASRNEMQQIVKSIIEKTDVHAGFLKMLEENQADFDHYARPALKEINERGEEMIAIMRSIPAVIQNYETHLGQVIDNLEEVKTILREKCLEIKQDVDKIVNEQKGKEDENP